MENEIEILAGKFGEKDKELILRSYKIAEDALKDLTRENKHPFIEHPVNVALIVANELGLMPEAVAAVFLHEATRGKDEMLQNLSKDFSPEIVTMAEGLNNISKITPKETKLQAENYRKLIISYSKDPRVTLIKIADRLEIMRNIAMFPKSKILQKLTETQMLYIPIAHQLGLYKIKSELENLYFKYSEPEQYRTITNKLLATEGERQKLAAEFIKPLEIKLHRANIKYTLKVRTKTAWSIWQKMQKQDVPFEGVYDVFAIRFILDVPLQKEKDFCWAVYSLVTQEYKPDVNRLRDWITNPKPNGYESLHTTVENKNGTHIEVQIRTQRMDDIAENGHASHWSYKGIKSVHGLDEWLGQVKTMLTTPSLLTSSSAPKDLDEIFVFTPNGDLKQLPKGATVLDFAFAIHSNLGMTCSGAKVNGKVMQIREKLHTGDVVEIMSNKNQKPSRDWLNIVVSSKARSRIRSRLKEDEEKQNPSAVEHEAPLAEKEVHAPAKEHRTVSLSTDYKGKDYLVISDKIDSIGYKMAKCCNPIFGDDVFGFVTANGCISIHRISCPNANRLLTQYPYRVQKVRWRQLSTTSQFQTGLKVIGNGDTAIGNAIMECIASQGASIRAFRISERKRARLEFVAELEISVGNNAHLDKVISALKRLHEVTTVLRAKK